ncbi:hypothetical protein BRD00_12790 [Halobacteriales archaeon QS_8_69_26]|nr:MAG: hypothetical protein BRD00_12790 [Halobacteriales archaeon QS_8_69_26]
MAESLPVGVDPGDVVGTMVADAQGPVLVVNGDRSVVCANQAVDPVFGYRPEELLGEPLSTVVPTRPTDRDRATMDRFLATGEGSIPPGGLVVSGKRADGDRVSLSAHLVEYEVTRERLVGLILRDVTGREERRRDLERENERLQRFARGLSHDLREPLNAARAQVAFARESGRDEHLDELASIHERMAEIVDDALALTKGMDSCEVEPVDIEGVAESVWRAVASDDAELVVEGKPTVDGHPGYVRTIVDNLVGNAVRHAGPDVVVSLGVLEEGKGFWIEDDGPGIPPEHREAVFDRSFSTDDAGTGLGLSIVRELADVHGWEVAATEGRDGGARFEVRGPAVE